MRGMLALIIIFLCIMENSAQAFSLSDALRRVVIYGHDLRMVNQEIESAKAQAQMARSSLLPQVSAFAGQNYYAYQPAAISGAQKLNTSEKSFVSMGVDFYQTVFDFGATRIRHKAVLMQEARAREEALGVKNGVVLKVIMAYIDVIEARRLMEVSHHELSALASHRKEMAILYREGVFTRHDVLSIRVRFNQARQKLIVARSREHISLAALKQVMSWKDEAPLEVEKTWPVNMPEISIQEAYASAMTARAELRGLDKAVLSADFDEKSASASDKPSVFFNGGYNYVDNRYQARDDNWKATLGVKFSVFNGGLTRATVAKARADKGHLIEERRQMEEKLRFEVEKAYWEMKNAYARMRLHESALMQADENRHVAWVRYREGAGTSVEYLDALVFRTAAETDLASGTYEYQRCQARFLYTMGKNLVTIYGQEADHEN